MDSTGWAKRAPKRWRATSQRGRSSLKESARESDTGMTGTGIGIGIGTGTGTGMAMGAGAGGTRGTGGMGGTMTGRRMEERGGMGATEGTEATAAERATIRRTGVAQRWSAATPVSLLSWTLRRAEVSQRVASSLRHFVSSSARQLINPSYLVNVSTRDLPAMSQDIEGAAVQRQLSPKPSTATAAITATALAPSPPPPSIRNTLRPPRTP